jgi:hypothetical protein
MMEREILGFFELGTKSVEIENGVKEVLRRWGMFQLVVSPNPKSPFPEWPQIKMFPIWGTRGNVPTSDGCNLCSEIKADFCGRSLLVVSPCPNWP